MVQKACQIFFLFGNINLRNTAHILNPALFTLVDVSLCFSMFTAFAALLYVFVCNHHLLKQEACTQQKDLLLS